MKKILSLTLFIYLNSCAGPQDGVLSSFLMGGALLGIVIISFIIYFIIDAFKSEGGSFNKKKTKKKDQFESLEVFFKKAREAEEKTALKPFDPKTMNYQIWADRRASALAKKKRKKNK